VSGLLEVNRHANESVLAMGDGLGLDWVRFAEGGANISVVDPSTERLKLYRQQFSARGVKAQCLHSPFDRLPASDSEVDVVCAVFNERPATWASLVQETQRVLRPGGKVIAVLPAHYNADRLLDIHRPWRVWRRPASVAPARFTAHELRKAFAGFYNVKVRKRHLRRSELPYIWRWVLLPIAERMMGRFLVVKAFKHLTPAMAAARAAA
jgi:ubiquinone/menaquinone biosynthesis C-methylase UbiE